MKRMFLLIVVIVIVGFLSAQIIAWDFDIGAGNEVSVNATTNDSKLATSVITRGTGLNPSSLQNAFSAKNFTVNGSKTDAITNNDYFQFSITPDFGYKVSLSTLDANFRRSEINGPIAFAWQYSLDAFATTGVAIESDISFTGTATNGTAQTQISLSGITALQNVESGTTITIRLYGWGAIGADGTFALGRLSGNDLAVGGAITLDDTLPVELSSFTVALNATNQAVLTWVTQTETGVSGFYIYRNTEYDLASAELISNLIPATNTSQQKVYIYRDKELSAAGTYYYWLQVADMDGSESYHGPVNLVYAGGDNQQSPGIPKITTLKNIYPNPFNPSTTISYGLDKTANVSIKIYNSRGQMVRSIDEGSKNAGYYNLTWNGDDDSGRTLPTGVYYIRMMAGNKSLNKKAVLMK